MTRFNAIFIVIMRTQKNIFVNANRTQQEQVEIKNNRTSSTTITGKNVIFHCVDISHDNSQVFANII